jgi:hypothetical protein
MERERELREWRMGCLSLNERESERRDMEEEVTREWDKNTSTVGCVLSPPFGGVRDIFPRSVCYCFSRSP